MANSAAEWLEALPYPAMLVAADTHILAANSACPFSKPLADMLEAAHPLLQAIAPALAEGRTTRLAALRLPGLPPCTAHVAPAPGGAALVMLELAAGFQLDVAETYTELSAELAATLAHEIRNPLLSIRGAAQLLAGSVTEADAPLTSLIITEVARIDQLIATMDPLSVTPPKASDAINVHEALEHARMAAVAAFGPHMQYRQHYDPSLPPVHANRDALVQALANLLKNAAEAVENAEAPTITLTSRYTLGETRRSAAGVALPIAISIADNGAGVPPRLEERLFAPFVTTKVQGKGLGLSIVARLVEEMGGLVAHDRPKEGGARFTLYLPAAA